MRKELLALFALIGLPACSSFSYLKGTTDPKTLTQKNALFATYDVNHSECFLALTNKKSGADLALRLPMDHHMAFAEFPPNGSYSLHRLECGSMRISPVLFRIDLDHEGLQYLGHFKIACEDDGLKKRCRFDILDGRDRPAYVRGEIAKLRADGHRVRSAYTQAEVTEEMIGQGEDAGWKSSIESETKSRKAKFDSKEIRRQVDKRIRDERLDNPVAFGQVQLIGIYADGKLTKTEVIADKVGTLSQRLRNRISADLANVATPELKKLKISVFAR